MSKDMEKFHRLVQQFLTEHGDDFASPMEAVSHFTEKYNQQLLSGQDFDETNEMKSMTKLEEAQSNSQVKRQKKLVDESIKLWPENWDAQVFKVHLDVGDDVNSLLENYAFLEKRARKHWHTHTDKVGYRNVEERPYLRLKARLGFVYTEAGMLDHALNELTELYRLDPTDALGVRYKIISLYARKFDWKNTWRFYQKVESAELDDQMLLPVIILAVLTDRKDLAKRLLSNLVDVNPQVGLLFVDYVWPIEDVYDEAIVFADSYQPFSYQSLLIALREILPLIMENQYLFEWLKKEVLNLLPEIPDSFHSNKLFGGVIDPDSNEGGRGFLDYILDTPSNPLRSISFERARLLYIAGLRTYEDFSEMTEKDVLKLNGIGPVTIKELKNNGVIFKT